MGPKGPLLACPMSCQAQIKPHAVAPGGSVQESGSVRHTVHDFRQLLPYYRGPKISPQNMEHNRLWPRAKLTTIFGALQCDVLRESQSTLRLRYREFTQRNGATPNDHKKPGQWRQAISLLFPGSIAAMCPGRGTINMTLRDLAAQITSSCLDNPCADSKRRA